MTVVVTLDNMRTGGDDGGFYIHTFTGKKFYWETIETNQYDIRDIAHALSLNCRWTGHVRKFYSVAQHSWLASHLVPREHSLAALLHDASEAYVHDTPSPLKWFLREHDFTMFADLEKKVDIAIFKAFKLAYPRDPCVKVVDLRLLATESRDLMPNSEERTHMIEPYDWNIVPWSADVAEEEFLRRYETVKGW